MFYKQSRLKLVNIAPVLVVVLFTCVFPPNFAIATNFQKLLTLAIERYGLETKNNIVELQHLLIQLNQVTEQEKLRNINDFFNSKIMFASDATVWGEADYWATPLESLGRQQGDCEDFTIAKYIFLKSLGIPNERLRLTYVRARVNSVGSQQYQAHMVLSYYETPFSEPMILDNLVPEILKSSQRKDLRPIFSFNSEGVWAGNKKSNSLKSLSRWRSVLTRTKNDGIY